MPRTRTVQTIEVPSEWDNRDVDIEHKGKKIILPGEPSNMPIPDAIEALERRRKDEETDTQVYEILDAFPEDAIIAFNWAMKEIYGWSSPIPKMTFFGPQPP